jgi:hypothetical protein
MAIDPRRPPRPATKSFYWVARQLFRVASSRRAEAFALLGAMAVVLDGSTDALPYGQKRAGSAPGNFEIRGFSYPSYHNGSYATADSTAALAALAKTGANFVAIVPTWRSRTVRDSEFFATDNTESDQHVLKAIADAHALGISVLLKPHVDPSDGKPRGAYDPANAAAWFANYKALLLRYAAMAASNHVEMFSVGCELESMVADRYRDQWLDIIHAVRQVYKGPIVYARAGLGEVAFWDAVDYIGIDAYDPLSDARHPSVAELAAGWTTISANPWVASQEHYHSPMQNYRALWERYHKPVVFTEIGYKSVAGDASRPGDWKWDGPVDLQVQARAYEAFFEVWSRQSTWVKGAFLWNWEPAVHPELSAYGAKGYTPQNKPAEQVIARWYQRIGGSSIAEAPSAGR